jgi:hypothetical protein
MMDLPQNGRSEACKLVSEIIFQIRMQRGHGNRF